jgi:hypothetical protein
MRRGRWSVGALTGAAVLLGSIVGVYEPAIAGSDNSTDTYAGDYAGGSFPAGTFFALQYLGYFHGDPFIDSAGHALQTRAQISSRSLHGLLISARSGATNGRSMSRCRPPR